MPEGDVQRAVDDLRLKTVSYVVEATDAERHLLWVQHSKESRAHGWGMGKESWSGRGVSGFLVKVGELVGLPVAMSVMFDTINGKPVLFWNPESRVVDWDMCRQWLEKNVSAYKGHHCNATNFGHCLAFTHAR